MKHSWAWLLFVVLCGVPGAPDPPANRPEKVYSEQTATWFEDAASRASVSADGRWAVYGGRGRVKLLNLETGREDPQGLAGLDRVWNAAFNGKGQPTPPAPPAAGLAQQGQRGGERGWFLADSAGLRLSPLPADAVPQWSPDGAWLAYYREQEPEQGLVVGTLSENKRYAVGGSVAGLAWSPDSRVVYALVWAESGVSSLVRLGRETGQVETLARQLDAAPRWNSLGVSSDGRRVYLALASEGPPDPEARHQPGADRDLDIYELELATGARRVVVATPEDDFGPTVAGGYLYWTHNHIRDSVVAVPAGGGEPRVVVEPGEIPYWSPDGQQLGFTYGGWRLADWALNLDAAVVQVNAAAERVSPPRPLVVGYHEDFTPAWSPDGQWIVYHSHRSAGPVAAYGSEGSTDDLYLRRASAGAEQEIRLTDSGWEVGMADWSPDGRRLVFCSWERGGPPGRSKPWMATIDPQTGKALRLEPLRLPKGLTGAELAAWSPRGDEIALEERVGDGRHALWVIRPDGKKARKLLEYPSSTYGGLDWTPDGKTIVYAALSEGRMQLFSLPRAGGPPRQLTRDPANLLHPQVSPDGRWIASTRIQQIKEIWRQKL